MPPSLTLIFRHRLERVCGEGRVTFFTCTHCVATPSKVSPTRLTSAVCVYVCVCVCVCVCGKEGGGVGGLVGTMLLYFWVKNQDC